MRATESRHHRHPSAARMMRWITTITGQGIRRPGYPADRWIERWLSERLRGLGMAEVRLEPVPLTSWRPRSARLRVGERRFDGFPLPHTAPTRALIAPLTTLGSGGERGALVVDELNLVRLNQRDMRAAAFAHHDPEGVFDTLVQTLPLGPHELKVMEPALAAGAAGFVGALTGMPWETKDYYVPYDAVQRPIPGLWLSPADSRALLAMMAAGHRTGHLVVDASTEAVTSHNVVGVLPGRSDHWVIVASHHDGPWASAVEDASGVALVLAVAEHFASLPPEKRCHNLLFLFTAGHMAGAAGTRAFIEAHRKLLDATVLEVHLEHAALRCESVAGRLRPTSDPEVRWWFTTEIPALQNLVARAVREHDLRRSLVLRPDLFGPMPPTDGAYFHPAGVPLAQFLSAPMYLFDSADTLDKVDRSSLEPLAWTAIQIVDGTAGMTPESLREH